MPYYEALKALHIPEYAGSRATPPEGLAGKRMQWKIIWIESRRYVKESADEAECIQNGFN
jgi:hypothetical protein